MKNRSFNVTKCPFYLCLFCFHCKGVSNNINIGEWREFIEIIVSGAYETSHWKLVMTQSSNIFFKFLMYLKWDKPKKSFELKWLKVKRYYCHFIMSMQIYREREVKVSTSLKRAPLTKSKFINSKRFTSNWAYPVSSPSTRPWWFSPLLNHTARVRENRNTRYKKKDGM